MARTRFVSSCMGLLLVVLLLHLVTVRRVVVGIIRGSSPMLGQPNVIARLMGMEAPAIALATPAIPTAMVREAEETTINLLRTMPSSSSGEASPAKAVAASKLKQFKCSAFPHHGRINVEYYRYCLSKMKPRRRSRRSSSRRDHHDRHHPQEELLEKIKEEFRASWQQASMVASPLAEVEVEGNAAVPSASASGRRSSGADRAGWVDVDGRYIQRVAQENLRREKMARYGNGANGKVKEDGDDDVKATAKEAEEAGQQKQGGSEGAAATVAESEPASSDGHRAGPEEEFFRGSGGPAVSGDHDQQDKMSSTSENSRGTPTRIAILRPIGTPRATGDHREPAFGTPPPSWKATRGGGMEEFLRAVKERLDNEMKVKAGNGDVAPATTTTTTTTRRQWGSAEPEQDTERRIREAAGMAKEDLGRRLSRLESFRVFRGDRVGKGVAAAVKSPEHRMLKRVRARIEAMSPKKTRLNGSSSPVSSRGGRVWSSPPADASLSGIGSDDEEGEGMSGRTGEQRRLTTKLWKIHGAAHTADTAADVVASPSPRALVRSLSAPASWRVSDGGSETTRGEGAEVRLSRSRSFSILRGTVASGLKQSFSLLLMHLTKKSPSSSPQDSGSLITAAQADFVAGLAPPCPVSPLEVHGRSPRHFSGCTLLPVPESSPRRSPKCSSEFGASVGGGGGGESPWSWRTDAAAAESNEGDDPDKAYVRELLIAAGLDDDEGGGESPEDTAGPVFISEDVFYEVEDAYYYRRLRRRVEEDGAGEEEEEEEGWADRRRLLFDLANDALQALQAGPSSSTSSLCRWFVSSAVSRPLRGKDIEDEVWRHVARAMTGDDDGPAPASTVDGMVEREVRKSPWMDAQREDVCAVGRKVERAIFDELVSEVVRQVYDRT